MKISPLHKRLQATQAKRLGYSSLARTPKEIAQARSKEVGHYDKNFGWVGPNKPDKGKRLGSCNVTACQRPGAYWYNEVMNAWYCSHCAHEINYQPLDDGTYLCTLDEEAYKEYIDGHLKEIGLYEPE